MSNAESALTSPNGLIPDFAHPRDALKTVLLVTQCICIPICSIVFALRVFVRFRFCQPLGVDEYFGFTAWLLFTGYCITAIFLANNGGGYHQWDIYKSQLIVFLKISYIATLFYAPMALFVKVALLTLLARVFKPYHKWTIVIYTILAIVLAYYIPAFIIKVRICTPISAYWNGTDGGGSCLNQGKVIVADSVVSVVTDLAILILPLPLTWSLHMPTEKKLKVVGLLSAGGLATGFSLYRLVMIIREGQSPDQTMVFTKVVLTGNAVGGIGLICACLPALNILISRSRNVESYLRKKDYHDKGNCSASNIQLSRLLNRIKDGRTASKDYSELRDGVENSDGPRSNGQTNTIGVGIIKGVSISQSVECAQ